jgi:hypothetical protein
MGACASWSSIAARRVAKISRICFWHIMLPPITWPAHCEGPLRWLGGPLSGGRGALGGAKVAHYFALEKRGCGDLLRQVPKLLLLRLVRLHERWCGNDSTCCRAVARAHFGEVCAVPPYSP